jgi:hypothetical protein
MDITTLTMLANTSKAIRAAAGACVPTSTGGESQR